MFVAVVVGATLLLSVVAGLDLTGNVAFTAGFKEDRIVENGKIVVYPEVFTNYGNGYNKNTGLFTAPKGGIYVFNFHALTTKGKDFWLDLYKNNDYMISAFGRQKGDFGSGGNTITLSLVKGDRVYIKTRREVSLYGRPDDVYATFTGYLIGLLYEEIEKIDIELV